MGDAKTRTRHGPLSLITKQYSQPQIVNIGGWLHIVRYTSVSIISLHCTIEYGYTTTASVKSKK